MGKSEIGKIVLCLSTRFKQDVKDVNKHLKWNNVSVQRWARLRVLPAGDDMYAFNLMKNLESRRDATVVRVCVLSHPPNPVH
jgi:hypothetical protein